MTVAQLITWVDRAIEAREKSFIVSGKSTPDMFIPGSYGLNNQQALNKTMLGHITKYEKEIASLLIGWSNDITDWKKLVDIENQSNFTLLDRKNPWEK